MFTKFTLYIGVQEISTVGALVIALYKSPSR